MTSITTGAKTPPANYLGNGWHPRDNTACFPAPDSAQATLIISQAEQKNKYLMAEIALLPEAAPQQLTIAINDEPIGEWLVDSCTIHDKLLIIPEHLQQQKSWQISFALKDAKTHSAPIIALHSFTLDVNLNSYLLELQTGYDWVCSIREELIKTSNHVFDLISKLPSPPKKIETQLKNILNNPFTLAQHQQKILFDEAYFSQQFDLLKEGKIHQQIRTWAAKLQQMQETIITIGNYAAKETDDQKSPKLKPEINNLNYENFTEEIAQLREINETINNLEIILQKEKIQSTPSTLYLDITNRCNFRCRMCYQSKHHFLQTTLSTEHMAGIINILPCIHNITIAGLGEPLLSPNLEDFATAANKLHCHTTVITNGSLIAKRLEVLRNFSKVSISFDGARQETFETIRQRSNFKQIISNIKLLCQSAPQLTIALSVVISRANLDEISEIMQIAGEIGVNEIDMTPMEHITILELKKSDLPLFQEQITKSEPLLTQKNITLVNNVSEDNFSAIDDTPRDKKKIIDYIKSMDRKIEQSYDLNKLTKELTSQTFSYYPATEVFGEQQPTAPDITGKKTSHKTNHTNPQIPTIESMLTSSIKHLNTLKDEISSLPKDHQYTIPYCLDPWKLNYIKSNGQSRLCCHSDLTTGNPSADGLHIAKNSQQYQDIRHAMFNHDKLPPDCRKCRAADRKLGIDSLNKTCKELS